MAALIFVIEDLLRLAKIFNNTNLLVELDREILYCLSWNPFTWAYKIYKEKVLENQGADPAVLRRRIRKLRTLGLVGTSKDGVYSKAKCLKLTDAGIYYLFLGNRRIPDKVLNGLFRNYADNIIFQLFLYPYINHRTVYELINQDSALASIVYTYLHECCKQIEDCTNTISRSKIGYSTEQIFWWDYVPDNNYQTNNLLKFLRRKFEERREPKDWIGHAEIERSADNNTMIISGKANIISISLNESKTKAIVKMRGKTIHEFIVDNMKGLLSIEDPYTSIEESATQFLLLGTQQRVPYFLRDLAASAVSGCAEVKLLLRDEKFMRFYRKTLKKVDIKFEELEERQKTEIAL